MHQQINFYQSEFRREQQFFSAATLLMACGAFMLVMLLSYAIAMQKLNSIENTLQIVSSQEAAAVERLEKIGPIIADLSGEKTWTERLDIATHSLEEKQLALSLVQGSTLGDTQGFSRHLRSLALQDTDGLWLTQIRLSALGDNTRLEGKALRADLVPAYLQSLAEEPPFATQRFHQFQIVGPDSATGSIVTFSMNSDAQLISGVADAQ